MTGGDVDSATQLGLRGYDDFVLLARGGGSLVYRARQATPERYVAIKVITEGPDIKDAADRRRWFERELDITVRLGRAHPHIVKVLDTGITAAGDPCLVMEFHEYGSLFDQLRTLGPLPPGAVASAGSVIADALAFAHTQGVLHRDVKPGNVLVLATSFVLADFGLARSISDERSASLELLSYRYASPQVLDGELPTAADDLYALGATLFTLLDGRAPFAAAEETNDSALAYLRRARTESPRVLARTDVAPELVAVISRCLARDRDQRWPDAASLRDALQRVPGADRSWRPVICHPLPERAPQPAAPQPAAPRPAVAPQPLALSAMNHLGAATIAPAVAADQTIPPQREPTSAVDSGRIDRRRLPVWLRPVLAVLIGASLGLGAALLTNMFR